MLNRRAALAVILLLGMVSAALAAPWIAPFDPMQTMPSAQLQPPSPQHVLGTDFLGRDVFSRLLVGGRSTLLMAAVSALIACTTGLLWGITASGHHPVADTAQMLIQSALALPGMLIALVVVTLIGPGLSAIILATAAAQAAPFAYVVRALLRQIEQSGYVEAAQSMGAAPLHILQTHLLPNALPLLLAAASTTFAYALLNSAGLSFLGLAGQPGIPDWGVMLAESRNGFRLAPWTALYPGLLIFLVVSAINTLADSLTQFVKK